MVSMMWDSNSSIPTVSEYWQLQETSLFKEMQSYNDDFLLKYKNMLKNYYWSANPFFEWSRRWEYPYTFAKLESLLGNKKPEERIVLDAGSGCTFFPFYLATRAWKVHCCDYTSSLASLFNGINSQEKFKVSFDTFDLRALKYSDGLFDAIFSISVLEHTDNYKQIIQQFSRILKSTGYLILTFDIPTTPAGIKKATDLLITLKQKFDSIGNVTIPDIRLISDPSIVSTSYIYTIDKKMLPLCYQGSFKHNLKTILFGLRLPEKNEPLTFHCSAWKKK